MACKPTWGSIGVICRALLNVVHGLLAQRGCSTAGVPIAVESATELAIVMSSPLVMLACVQGGRALLCKTLGALARRRRLRQRQPSRASRRLAGDIRGGASPVHWEHEELASLVDIGIAMLALMPMTRSLPKCACRPLRRRERGVAGPCCTSPTCGWHLCVRCKVGAPGAVSLTRARL